MVTTHTPGKWKINFQLDGSIFIETESRSVAMLQGETDQMTAEDESNARLIAAAPELLYALEYLTKNIDISRLNIKKDFSLINAHNTALKAIRKAVTPSEVF